MSSTPESADRLSPTTSPSGLYEVPVTTCSAMSSGAERGYAIATTAIWLVVRVPVLSEQMTVVQPSVSTEGSLRTMALRLTILRVPRARQSVMTAGRPSGMAATPSATAILR